MLTNITMAVRDDPEGLCSKLWEVPMICSNTSIAITDEEIVFEVRTKLFKQLHGGPIKLTELKFKLTNGHNTPFMMSALKRAVNDE